MAQNNFPNVKSAYAPINISTNVYSQSLIVKITSGMEPLPVETIEQLRAALLCGDECTNLETEL